MLVVGIALGGTFGIGTIAFAVLIGPIIEVSFGLLARSPLAVPASPSGPEIVGVRATSPRGLERRDDAPVSDEVFDRLEQIYAIGGGDGRTVPASVRGGRGLDLAAGWMEKAGLEVERDPTGNLGRRGCAARTRRCPRSGAARTSTPSRRAASSTARSASSLRSRQSSGSGGSSARSAWSSSAPRRRLPGEQGYEGPLPGAFLELHIEQGRRLLRCGPAAGRRQRDRRLLPPRGRLRGRRRATPARRRWPGVRTRS